MTRRAACVAIALGAVAVFGVACAYTRYVPLNPDIAWQVYIAVALTRGAQLGRDLIEVNPPLAAWLDVPVVQLGALLGLSPAFGHQLAMVLLGLWSVTLVTLAGRLVAALQRSTALVGFSLACAIPLALHGGLEVGQREQMAILLALPYFILLAARLEGAQVSARLALMVGISAGLGFALKPFFVLPLALGELLMLVERRSLRAPFRIEMVGMATVFAAYPVAILLAAPDWLASAREFWPLYGGYRVATARDILARHGTVAQPAALLAWALARAASSARPRLGDALAAGLVGFAMAMLLQRKPWTYLTLPSAVLAVALLMATVLETSRMRTPAGRLRARRWCCWWACAWPGTPSGWCSHRRNLPHLPHLAGGVRVAARRAGLAAAGDHLRLAGPDPRCRLPARAGRGRHVGHAPAEPLARDECKRPGFDDAGPPAATGRHRPHPPAGDPAAGQHRFSLARTAGAA